MLSENAETSANALRRGVLRFKDFLSHAQEIQTVYANFFLFTAPPTRRQNAYERGGLFKKNAFDVYLCKTGSGICKKKILKILYADIPAA